MVGGTVELFPPSHFHLQHLNLLCVNMQISYSNVDLPLVSATIGEMQGTSDVILCEESGLETVRNGVSYRQRQLVEEKTNIIQSNASPKQFSSTIWRLPTEILSEIFLYCLPEDRLLSPAPALAPVLLTTICRRWREVALGLPSLWCTLQLVGDDDWHKRAFFYDSWLKRSRGHPLSLSLECFSNLSEPQSLLQEYIPQISSLQLEFSDCDGPFIMEDFHALKELTINNYGFDPKRAIDLLPREIADFFSDSAWARLTHVEININGLDAFPRILHLCPNLSSVTVFGIFDPIQTPEPITHTNLQTLRMYGDALCNQGGDLGLFEVITLPNLRVVEVRHMGQWPHEEFKEFLTRSKCPLESLTFGSAVWTTDQQRAEYVTLLPSLELTAEPDSDFNIFELIGDL
ncbi:uncharacterized protein BJ212DRAFT_1482367 [Suillus subaureus]|uniref:F-box domain-containing protein n=1 Tax=Suillus subaureus TaxID=48587 RepID=A0A9P7E8U4_9AGAM|nr:uncharacterized protein BJ212DRAFT_1482367 [Suillus subaureus]KAG1814021.1 hypothetical protein BJ212DRAFT_1482367 [Suillus subaureus]